MSPPPPRLLVNPIRCDGAGYCAEILPERIRLDEWGYPVVDESPIDDPRLRALARRAVGECPRVALLLVGGDARRR